MTGYSRSWIYELVWGYNRLGESALGDKRHSNPGGKPLLNDWQQAQLWQLLQEKPSFISCQRQSSDSRGYTSAIFPS